EIREALPADADAAWAQVEKAQEASRPRPMWQGSEPKPEQLAAFQKEVQQANVSLARKAREFLARFPSNENAPDARFLVALALNQAVAAGDASSEEQLRQFVSAVVADKSIPEDDRVNMLLMQGNLPL